MPHQYNRLAFQAGMAGANALLSLYCSLVDLELALKDHFQPTGWRGGHRVIDWIDELGEAALAVQLMDRLGRLQCTARNGTQAFVHGNLYPDLRYLRHSNDWQGASTDVQLDDALRLVGDVRIALRARGVNL
jgi:hypothetical protein